MRLGIAMEEQPGLSNRYRRSSPWPLVIVLGVVLSELGILYGTLPVSVGGLVLLGASVVGILRESGYAHSLWAPALLVGALFGLLGIAFYLGTAATQRALQVGIGGGILLVAGVTAYLLETGRL
jgi:hypothetical protein